MGGGPPAARAARADEVAIFASASEGFSKANLNATIAESLDRFRPVAEAARGDGIPVRVGFGLDVPKSVAAF